VTTYTYVTGANRVETVTSPRGYVTIYVWDGEQRIAVVNPRKNGDWLLARPDSASIGRTRGCLSPFFRPLFPVPLFPAFEQSLV
jgi:hypothetical protein